MPFLACPRLPDQVGLAPSCLFKSRGDLLFCGFIPRLSRVDEDPTAFGSSHLNLCRLSVWSLLWLPSNPLLCRSWPVLVFRIRLSRVHEDPAAFGSSHLNMRWFSGGLAEGIHLKQLP
ncbi:hypothetical protein F2Q69_00020755 [Brassica cretica]|uniref:Uncharacterized protein n=1 Tax=Brassica cretica TaxID=69181 RepID=A0A8S9Q5B6_BRACR|nr:hypothetical protein F2Q69_00020755 [Brassica cretica]